MLKAPDCCCISSQLQSTTYVVGLAAGYGCSNSSPTTASGGMHGAAGTDCEWRSSL